MSLVPLSPILLAVRAHASLARALRPVVLRPPPLPSLPASAARRARLHAAHGTLFGQ
jgi:hypothetical protein